VTIDGRLLDAFGGANIGFDSPGAAATTVDAPHFWQRSTVQK
jgi:hypothetical protein